MRVRGGHEKGGVDFETPGAALDGAGGGKFGEVAGWTVVIRGLDGVGALFGWVKGAYRSMENSIFSL